MKQNLTGFVFFRSLFCFTTAIALIKPFTGYTCKMYPPICPTYLSFLLLFSLVEEGITVTGRNDQFPSSRAIDKQNPSVFEILHNDTQRNPSAIWEIEANAVPGDTFPTLTSVIRTNFTCQDLKGPGFYADVETGCQQYHRCYSKSRQTSFICPPGTLFSQATLVCDFWYNVRCSRSRQLYEFANSRPNRPGNVQLHGNARPRNDLVLQSADSRRSRKPVQATMASLKAISAAATFKVTDNPAQTAIATSTTIVAGHQDDLVTAIPLLQSKTEATILNKVLPSHEQITGVSESLGNNGGPIHAQIRSGGVDNSPTVPSSTFSFSVVSQSDIVDTGINLSTTSPGSSTTKITQRTTKQTPPVQTTLRKRNNIVTWWVPLIAVTQPRTQVPVTRIYPATTKTDRASLSTPGPFQSSTPIAINIKSTPPTNYGRESNATVRTNFASNQFAEKVKSTASSENLKKKLVISSNSSADSINGPKAGMEVNSSIGQRAYLFTKSVNFGYSFQTTARRVTWFVPTPTSNPQRSPADSKASPSVERSPQFSVTTVAPVIVQDTKPVNNGSRVLHTNTGRKDSKIDPAANTNGDSNVIPEPITILPSLDTNTSISLCVLTTASTPGKVLSLEEQIALAVDQSMVIQLQCNSYVNVSGQSIPPESLKPHAKTEIPLNSSSNDSFVIRNIGTGQNFSLYVSSPGEKDSVSVFNSMQDTATTYPSTLSSMLPPVAVTRRRSGVWWFLPSQTVTPSKPALNSTLSVTSTPAVDSFSASMSTNITNMSTASQNGVAFGHSALVGFGASNANRSSSDRAVVSGHTSISGYSGSNGSGSLSSSMYSLPSGTAFINSSLIGPSYFSSAVSSRDSRLLSAGVPAPSSDVPTAASLGMATIRYLQNKLIVRIGPFPLKQTGTVMNGTGETSTSASAILFKQLRKLTKR